MRAPQLLSSTARFVSRFVLALRYYLHLRYSWHLSWVKAGGAR